MRQRKKKQSLLNKEFTLDLKTLHKKGRITQNDGYFIDRRIFRLYCASILFMVVLALAVLGLQGGAYVSCPEDAIGGKCSNPLFNYTNFWGSECTYDACLVETLQAGEEIGEKPPNSTEIIYFVAIFGFLVAVLINHLRQKESERLYYGSGKDKSIKSKGRKGSQKRTKRE